MKFLPQWTRRVAMEGSGRDPLGLSRVYERILNPTVSRCVRRALASSIRLNSLPAAGLWSRFYPPPR